MQANLQISSGPRVGQLTTLAAALTIVALAMAINPSGALVGAPAAEQVAPAAVGDLAAFRAEEKVGATTAHSGSRARAGTDTQLRRGAHPAARARAAESQRLQRLAESYLQSAQADDGFSVTRPGGVTYR